MSHTDWYTQAKLWINEASELIQQRLTTALKIETKAHHNDLVTNVDKEVEQFFKQKITRYPSHRLFGEEGDSVTDLAGYVWILDPIDGTMNFVVSQQNFAISLALYHDGSPVFAFVLDVTRNELYAASQQTGATLNDQPLPRLDPKHSIEQGFILCDFNEIRSIAHVDKLIDISRGHRRYGSAALEIVNVAAGRASLFLHETVQPWDIAAALFIAQQCGAVASRINGNTINLIEAGSLLVGSPKSHQQGLDLISR